jgi:3-methyladenine DNA glycosylase AlkD
VENCLEKEKLIIEELRRELESHADHEWKRKLIEWEQQYPEKVKVHGVPTPKIRELSAKHFSRNRSKREVFGFCEELLNSGYVEERTAAFDWAFRLKRHYEPSDYRVLESWLKNHVHDWGGCDDLCTHALGAFIFRFPEFLLEAKKWVWSDNRWIRRACAVVLIYSVRRGKSLEHVFEVADTLLMDRDAMVQKGYGWMLKEASNHYSKQVFNYVMEHRKEMPRTALRYAIEKLPPELRSKAMKRE